MTNDHMMVLVILFTFILVDHKGKPLIKRDGTVSIVVNFLKKQMIFHKVWNINKFLLWDMWDIIYTYMRYQEIFIMRFMRYHINILWDIKIYMRYQQVSIMRFTSYMRYHICIYKISIGIRDINQFISWDLWDICQTLNSSALWSSPSSHLQFQVIY